MSKEYQEYQISKIRIEFEEANKNIFLPPGSQVIETYYEAYNPITNTSYVIGGIDKLILFNIVKDKLINNVFDEKFQIHAFGLPDPLECTKITMIIKVLVPMQKSKQKYI